MILWQNKSVKNFHVPLPDPTYDRLRAEAERARMPATTLARHAIDEWLRQQARRARHRAISEYAASAAGTHADLDPHLEQAAIEHLLKTPK